MNVFICSPYQGDIEENTKNAKRYMRFVIQQGHTPFAPHLLYPQVLDEATERNKGMELDFDAKARMNSGLRQRNQHRYVAGNQGSPELEIPVCYISTEEV